MYDDDAKVEANGEENAESENILNTRMYSESSSIYSSEFNSEFNSELYGELGDDSGGETEDEGPKWIPRKIIIGFVIVCFGVSIMLYNFGFFHIRSILWFLPFVLVVTGLLRILKKGFFNGPAQFLIIGGLQLHLALLGYKKVLGLGLPILVIWVGILVVIKGFLPYKGYQKYRRYSDFKILLQQKQNADADMPSDNSEPDNKEQIQ